MRAAMLVAASIAFPSCSSLPQGTALEYSTAVGGVPVSARYTVGGKAVISLLPRLPSGPGGPPDGSLFPVSQK